MYFLLPDDNPNLTVHKHESFGSVSESVMNQIEEALTGNYLVRMKVLRMTQLSHEVSISHVTNSC